MCEFAKVLQVGDEWSETDSDGTNIENKPSQPNGFPFSTQTPSLSMNQLQAQLPDIQRAHVLCQSWLDHGTMFFRPTKRDELFEEILPMAYEQNPSRELPAHTLACLFFMLALGSLFDRNSAAFNAQADALYDFGRICLSLRPIMESPQFDTVRAVGLLATYSSMAGKRYSREIAVRFFSLVNWLSTDDIHESGQA